MGAVALGLGGGRGEPDGNDGFGGVHPGALVKARNIWSASPLSAIAGALRAMVFDVSAVEPLASRRVLGVEGQPMRAVVVLGSGRVRVERRRPGGGIAGRPAFPVGHRGPGDLVGLAALATGDATATSTVVDAGEALCIPVKALRRLAADEPALRAALRRAAVSSLAATQRRIETSLACSVEAKLARVLQAMVARWGAPHAEGTQITAPFTHADLAAYIGSTRETVTLLLGRLRREGVLVIEHRRVVVRDAAALDRYAAG